ncbi:MAG: TetR/AcrR family transcriptional regulator [Novosphingobium sp.]|nr:TetR/AcrR family transcriptional regulator [Novosphingobium sp.]
MTDEDLQDRRVRKTRRAIRDALETLLQHDAIEQITAKEIAAEADIGYTTFFRHFATKEAALADLADSEAEELIRHCLPLLRSADSLAATAELCRHVERKRRVWTALLLGGAAGLLRDALIRHTTAMSHAWPAGRSGLPAGTGTALIVGLVVESLSWWLSHAPELGPDEAARIMDRVFIAGLVGES